MYSKNMLKIKFRQLGKSRKNTILKAIFKNTENYNLNRILFKTCLLKTQK